MKKSNKTINQQTQKLFKIQNIELSRVQQITQLQSNLSFKLNYIFDISKCTYSFGEF